MKDPTLFLLKNSLASKMKRGIRNFCSGVGSTSTLNQRKEDSDLSCDVAGAAPSVTGSNMEDNNNNNNNSNMAATASPRTLEQMLLQLDLEEAAARRAKLDDYGELQRRMSCVNNSDILKSARNALNQYPRFSLDGRDAMYRSSFRNLGLRAAGNIEGGRRSVCCSGVRRRPCMDGYELPSAVGGESVVWCKPGVVARLMGLDAVPVPVGYSTRRHGKRRASPADLRRQNLRRMGRHELERERLVLGIHSCKGRMRREAGVSSSAYDCYMNPVCFEQVKGGDWRLRWAR